MHPHREPRGARPQGSDPGPDAVARALGGNQVEFRSFYRRFDPVVRRAIGRYTRHWPSLVPVYEDLVQEVWEHLLAREGDVLRRHDPARGVPFWQFVALVSRRLGWRFARKRLGPNHGRPQIQTIHCDLELRVGEADLLQRLTALALERLRPGDRRLFVDHCLRGESVKEVGRRLGWSENTAHQRNSRLRRKLQDMRTELLQPAISVSQRGRHRMAVDGRPVGVAPH